MNQENFNILYKNTVEALDNYRLKDALSCLHALCVELNDATLSIEQESIDSTYQMMLHFMSEGGKDPQRFLIHDGLLQRSYALLTRSTRTFKQHNGTGIYADTLRKTDAEQRTCSRDALIERIRLQMEALSQTTGQGYDMVAQKNLTDHLNQLFNYIWTDPLYETTEAQALANFLSELNSVQTRFLLSALMLSLLEGFDAQKFRIILSFMTRDDEEIRCHALIVFYFICQKHEKEIRCHRNLLQEISQIKNDARLQFDLIQLQKQLIICQKTEKAEKQMQEKIMPQLIKGNWNQISKIGIDDQVDLHDLLKNNLNSSQEKRLQDSIQKIIKMNEEGIDINTGIFKSMCNLPFFHSLTNWFWPFDDNHPDIYPILHESDGNQKKISKVLNSTIQMCDLDKYGMAILINNLPVQNKDALMNDLLSTLDYQAYSQLTDKSVKAVLKSEAQSLYRFFYFYTFKTQFYNPFQHNCLFTDNQFLSEIVRSTDFEEEMADFLSAVEEDFEAVIEYTEHLIKSREVTAKYLKQIGFAYQQTGNFNKALQYYQQADLLEPNNEWTLNQQQHCYEQTGRTDLRLQCLIQLEEMEPDKVEISMEIILCLIQLKRFDEALKKGFKLEYLGKKELFAQRIIGWSYLQTQQAEQALKYYEKILSHPKAKWEDYINAGHAAWILGNLPKAVEYYRTFVQRYLKNDPDWESKFLEDRPLFDAYQIESKDIYLMMDLIHP